MNSFYDKLMFIVYKNSIIFMNRFLYLKIFLLKCNNKCLNEVAPKGKVAPMNGMDFIFFKNFFLSINK